MTIPSIGNLGRVRHQKMVIAKDRDEGNSIYREMREAAMIGKL